MAGEAQQLTIRRQESWLVLVLDMPGTSTVVKVPPDVGALLTTQTPGRV
jgi:hypothetical protein